MATAGLGVDVARIGRFRQMIDSEKWALIERLFTEGERDYALLKKDPAPHLAARFAAKEAYLKALGTGLRLGMSWQEIEVVRGDLGQPSLRLSGRAAEIFRERGLAGVHLSYSHDGDYAFATVILEGP